MSSGYPDMVNMDMVYLRQHLNEHGIGIVRFCESIGRSPTWFYKHEAINGRTNFRMAKMIANMYDVPYEKLVPDERIAAIPKNKEEAQYHTIPLDAIGSIPQDALYKFLRTIADALNEMLDEKKGA